jgi:hypothetical protein
MFAYPTKILEYQRCAQVSTLWDAIDATAPKGSHIPKRNRQKNRTYVLPGTVVILFHKRNE